MPELHFKGKEFVYNHHLTVPYRPLVPHPKKSIGKNSGNLIIHGDNLHALKALLPQYAGKIDCIFIDPPYNTGNEGWAYNDNVNSPMHREWLGQVVGADDLLRHDKWCCMMWPRLKLLKELLASNGTLFVCIDDNEVHRLRSILDELEYGFIGQFVWKSRQNKDNRTLTGASIDHEYIICLGNRLRGAERKEEMYSNPDNDHRGPWSSGNMVGLATKERRPNLHFDLINPNTGINYGCPRLGWRYGPQRMNQLIAENRIIWPDDPTGRPREKVFIRELEQRYTGYSSVVGVNIFTRDGTRELDGIFGKRVFEFPKPSVLIRELIEQGCMADSIVLDSFAGAGTTGHAVLAQNAKDDGVRQFILVECEDYADKLTAERMRRVIKGYEFEGVHKEELLSETLTWTKIKNPTGLRQKVEAIQEKEESRFDRIFPEVKNGNLVVIGEKRITERVEGLGGGFTYCTLGDPLDLDAMLTGKGLPDNQTLGGWLFHTATGETLSEASVETDSWFVGESAGYCVWLIYKPDREWLRSREAALTLSLAEKISKSGKGAGKRHLVFAPARFVSSRQLHPLGVEYAPLPFALYRVERE